MVTKDTRKEINNILVIKLRYLGDVVLTTPVFEALRYYYPEASITALVNKGTDAMLINNPNVDRIFVVERDENPLTDLKKQIDLILKLRRLHFDMALELTKNDRGAAYSFLSGAKKRLGYKSKPENIRRFDRHLLFTDLIVIPKGTHMVDRHLQMIEQLGHVPPSRSPVLYWDKEESLSCEEILLQEGLSLDSEFVVLHPILKSKYRAWRIEGYAKLCDHLKDEFDITTVLVCGDSRDEVDFTNKIAGLSRSCPVNLGGRLSLRHLVVLLANATMFVGIDSGPMHMAAAVKTPVVAIFGPTEKKTWAPWGENHTIVQKEWECIPCIKEGCNNSGKSRCLDELSCEDVIGVAGSRLRTILERT